MKWTLTLRESEGKLVGTAGSEEGEIPINDATFENGTLTFKVVMDSETYTVEVRVAGDRLDGSWKGGGESGAIRGARKV